MERTIKWTIQGQRGSEIFPVLEFDTKRAAIKAMEAQREPKTLVFRPDPHHYTFTVRKK
jgi:hypothetical protein